MSKKYECAVCGEHKDGTEVVDEYCDYSGRVQMRGEVILYNFDMDFSQVCEDCGSRVRELWNDHVRSNVKTFLQELEVDDD